MRRRGIALALSLVASAAAFGCDALLTEAPDSADLFDAPLDGLTRGRARRLRRGRRGVRTGVRAGRRAWARSSTTCRAPRATAATAAGVPENVADAVQPGPRSRAGARRAADPGPSDPGRRSRDAARRGRRLAAAAAAGVRRRADRGDSRGHHPRRCRLPSTPTATASRAARTGCSPRGLRADHEPGGRSPACSSAASAARRRSRRLLQQMVEAYHQDMGITSDFLPAREPQPARRACQSRQPIASPTPRVPAAHRAVGRALHPHARAAGAREPTRRARERGRALFDSVGCAACHVPTLRPARARSPRSRTARCRSTPTCCCTTWAMALADNRPDGAASGREWRTTPLWGLRLMRAVPERRGVPAARRPRADGRGGDPPARRRGAARRATRSPRSPAERQGGSARLRGVAMSGIDRRQFVDVGRRGARGHRVLPGCASLVATPVTPVGGHDPSDAAALSRARPAGRLREVRRARRADPLYVLAVDQGYAAPLADLHAPRLHGRIQGAELVCPCHGRPTTARVGCCAGRRSARFAGFPPR